MNPHILQQKIHSTFSNVELVWSNFKDEISESLFGRTDQYIYNGHLIREYNRKVVNFGFTGLAYIPYDGGYRFIGTDLGINPDNGYVFLYTDEGIQVFTDEDLAVQVPDSFANS